MNRKEFLIISVGIFLTIIAWIIIDIYHIKSSKFNTASLKQVTLVDYEVNKKIINLVTEKNP